MDYNSLSLKMHEEHKGKVEVVSKVAVKNRDDLSTAYTPGVAELAERSVTIRLTYTNIHARATWLPWYQTEQRFSVWEI